MKFDRITEDNILIFAIKHYEKPQCVNKTEFDSDMKRFGYVKRLLNKYASGDELKERLLVNHVIILINLFGIDAATTLLLFKIERPHWNVLKAVFIFLNVLLPNDLKCIDEDKHVLEILEKI